MMVSILQAAALSPRRHLAGGQFSSAGPFCRPPIRGCILLRKDLQPVCERVPRQAVLHAFCGTVPAGSAVRGGCCFFSGLFIPLYGLTGFGRHEFIELQILVESILEGDDDVPVEEEALAFSAVGDIGELVGRDIELFCQDLAVAGSLVQHVDEV